MKQSPLSSASAICAIPATSPQPASKLRRSA